MSGTVRASSSLARRSRPASLAARLPSTAASSFAEALTAALAAELEEDNRRVSGATLAAVAQQYEDAEGFGPNALRALAQKFYKSPRFVPSEVHAALAALPFSLILTTCQDDLLAQALQAAGKDPIVQRYHLRGDKRDNPEFLLPSSPQTPAGLSPVRRCPGTRLARPERERPARLPGRHRRRAAAAAQQPDPRAQAGRPELPVRRLRHQALVPARAAEGAGARARAASHRQRDRHRAAARPVRQRPRADDPVLPARHADRAGGYGHERISERAGAAAGGRRRLRRASRASPARGRARSSATRARTAISPPWCSTPCRRRTSSPGWTATR